MAGRAESRQVRQHCLQLGAGLLSFGVALAPAVSAAPTSSEASGETNCVDGLRIRAKRAHASALLEQLKQGRLSAVPRSECNDATVRLAAVNGGWRVGLERGGRQVTRDAATLQLVGMWLESWLEPTTSDEGPLHLERDAPPPDRPAELDAPKAPASPPPDRAPPSAANLGARAGVDAAPRAVGAVAVGGSASRWVGSGLVVRLAASEGLWVGPELEALWNTGGDPARRWLSAGAAFGARVPLSRRFTLLPSLSLGIGSVSFDTGVQTASGSGPYVGAGCDVGFALLDRLSIVAGVGGRRLFTDSVRVSSVVAGGSGREGENDSDDSRLVSSELTRPTFAGSAHLGLSLALGGTP